MAIQRTAANPVAWSATLLQHYGVLASRLGSAGVAPATTMLGVTRLVRKVGVERSAVA